MVWAGFFISAAVSAGPFSNEVLCKKALWAASYNFSSVEQAKKGIPKNIRTKMVLSPREARQVIPLEIRKDPEGKGIAYYEDWAGIIFMLPWDVQTLTGNWSPEIFYLVTPEGEVISGKLPNKLSNEKSGTFQNLIEFVEPTTKRDFFLTCDNKIEFPAKPEDDFVSRQTSAVYTGEMEPYRGKYTHIDVDKPKVDDVRGLVQASLAEELLGLVMDVQSGERKKDVGRLAYETCKKIDPTTQILEDSLKELKNRID